MQPLLRQASQQVQLPRGSAPKMNSRHCRQLWQPLAALRELQQPQRWALQALQQQVLEPPPALQLGSESQLQPQVQ